MKLNAFIFTSIVLSFVAGFADTSTFVGADGLFSAHVTGNFVIFAYDIVTNQIAGSWLKLISFPVFILAVFISTQIFDYVRDEKKSINRFMILEAILLIIAGMISWIYRHENTDFTLKGFIPMLLVFAMGLQNACGRFFTKEVLAPTTIMTGNTTQFIIDLTAYLKNKDQGKQNLKQKLLQEMYVIFPFLMGCITGGFITKKIGLESAFIIGLLLVTLTLFRSPRKTNSPILIAY
jgi:uncharacterized membrane protein YoaK (UPF0700 family)